MILPPSTLTPSGRPKLAAGEVERLLLDKVDLEFDGVGGTEGCQTADRYQGGYAVVTSQRLIWIDAAANPSAGRSCCLPLEAVHSTRKHVQFGLNLMNPKVRLEVKVFVDVNSRPSHMQAAAAFRYLQLRCRGDGPDALNEQLLAALAAHKQQLEQQAQQQQRRQQQQLQQQEAGQLPGAQTGQQQGIPWVSSGSRVPGGPMPSVLGAVQQQQQQQQQHAAQQAAVQHQPQIQAVDVELLSTLVDMGFPCPRVLRALMATHSDTLQAALDWILAAGGEPGVDEPLPGPQPSAVSRQELQQLQQLQRSLNQQHHQHQQQQQPAGLPGWSPGSMGAAAAGSSVVLPPSAGFGGVAGAAAMPAGRQAAAGGGVVGVAGIIHREAAKTSQTSASLAVAFQDLDNLMDMAADMVKLAEKFRGVMGPDGSITQLAAAAHGFPADTSSGASGGSSSSRSSLAAGAEGGELLLDSETQLQLIAMGIASPVTKASAGSRYQQELSRQLADFLAAPLARAGGVMLLPDVYCLFNRARGSELVSPDDLIQACEAFPVLGLPLRLRKFPSGVIVVQGSQFSDAQLCKSIEQLLQSTPADAAAAFNAAVSPPLGAALSAGVVSGVLSLPLTLAREALLVAEAAGVLCRDDGPEGLRFFRNFFRGAQPVSF